MNSATHEEIAGRARQLWLHYGGPSGRDVEIWLEAERQVAAEKGPSQGATGSSAETIARLKDEMAAESTAEFHISPPIPDEQAIEAALQKPDRKRKPPPGIKTQKPPAT